MRGLESGMVGINIYCFGMPEAPFGGVKQSGYGSENVPEGIEAYLAWSFPLKNQKDRWPRDLSYGAADQHCQS